MSKIFVTTVKIGVVVDTEDEAFDAISAALSDNLENSGAILDWGYINATNPFEDKGKFKEDEYEAGGIFSS